MRNDLLTPRKRRPGGNRDVAALPSSAHTRGPPTRLHRRLLAQPYRRPQVARVAFYLPRNRIERRAIELLVVAIGYADGTMRSEERRVGKESRSRGVPDTT